MGSVFSKLALLSAGGVNAIRLRAEGRDHVTMLSGEEIRVDPESVGHGGLQAAVAAALDVDLFRVHLEASPAGGGVTAVLRDDPQLASLNRFQASWQDDSEDEDGSEAGKVDFAGTKREVGERKVAVKKAIESFRQHSLRLDDDQTKEQEVKEFLDLVDDPVVTSVVFRYMTLGDAVEDPPVQYDGPYPSWKYPLKTKVVVVILPGIQSTLTWPKFLWMALPDDFQGIEECARSPSDRPH